MLFSKELSCFEALRLFLFMVSCKFHVILYTVCTQDAFGRYQGKDSGGSNGDLLNMCQTELLRIGEGLFHYWISNTAGASGGQGMSETRFISDFPDIRVINLASTRLQ